MNLQDHCNYLTRGLYRHYFFIIHLKINFMDYFIYLFHFLINFKAQKITVNNLAKFNIL